MKRCTDFLECKEITKHYSDYFTFDEENWFRNERNFAFIEGENIAFGEDKGNGIYWVHFCFHTARGRAAIDLTRKMFAELCKLTDLRVGIGLILVENKKAKWLIRQVGFKSLGEVDADHGRCEMFYAERSLVDEF